jgi:hypothetical protein
VADRALAARPVTALAVAIPILATLVLAALTLAGCSDPEDTPARENERTTTMAATTVRTDATPITSRFPALAEYQDLHWTGEAAGAGEDGQVPGPTDVRIRAIVVLTPEAARRTASGYSWTPAPTEWESAVQDPLRDHLSDQGVWQSDEAYTDDLLGSGFGGTVYFNPTTGTVYLDVIGR